MRYTRLHPAVDEVIVGARRASRLDALAPTSSVQRSSVDIVTIETILAGDALATGPGPEGI
jgi:hypothetical protein